MTSQKKSTRLASSFIKKLEKKYQYKQSKKLSYYVIDKNRDVMSFCGFQFNLLSTSFFSKRIASIYTNKYGEFNKHELTHYFFQDFGLDKFLSEGLAVYYNIENENITQNLSVLKNHMSTFSDAEKNNWITDYLKGKYLGGTYQLLFYSFSGLIVSDFLNENDELALREVIVNTPDITPEEFIKKHLKSISNPKKYLWSKVN